MRTLDIKSILVGIVVAVVSGLLLQAALALFSKNPKTEVVAEYFPAFAPQEFNELFRANTYSSLPNAIMREVRDKYPATQISSIDIKTIIDTFHLDEIAKFGDSASVYRLTIANRGALSEKDVKIWVKGAKAYYKRTDGRAIRTEADKDGYINLAQVNPGESYEFFAIGGIYYVSSLVQEDIRAFSNSGTIPILLYTMKPSLFSQLTEPGLVFLMLMIFVGISSAFSLAFPLGTSRKSQTVSNAPPSQSSSDEEKDG